MAKNKADVQGLREGEQVSDLDRVNETSEFYIITEDEEGNKVVDRTYSYIKTGENVARMHYPGWEDPALVFFTATNNLVAYRNAL